MNALRRRPVLAAYAWALLLGVMVIIEGLGLSLHGWPTISDLVRDIMRPAIGRWALFAFWLWFGWEFLARRGERA